MTNAERQRRHRKRVQARKKELIMPEAQALRPAPPLPATAQDLLSQYKLKAKRTINDLVEDSVVKLWENEKFQRFVQAIYDSEAVEGSMDIDDMMAAMMIRDQAKADGIVELANQKLDAIVRALRVVLKRFSQGRAERRGE